MKTSTLVFGAITLSCCVVTGVMWKELQAERRRSVERAVRVVEPAVGITLLSSQPAETSSLPPQIAVRLDAGPSAASTGIVVNSHDNLQVDPAVYQAMLVGLRQQMPRGYPDLILELGLTPDQADQLFDLLVKQEDDRRKNSAAIRNVSEAERIRAYADIDEKHKAELSATLGSKYSQFEEYKKTQSARQQVANARASMESSGAAMREDQVGSLKQTMIHEQQRVKQEEQSLARRVSSQQPQTPEQFAGSLFDIRAESDSRIVSDARAYLTDRQLSILRAQLESNTSASRAGFQRPPDAGVRN